MTTENRSLSESPATCEYVIEWGDTPGKALTFCGTPATKRYPANMGGFMHLCDEHSIKHLNYAEDIMRDRGGYPNDR